MSRPQKSSRKKLLDSDFPSTETVETKKLRTAKVAKQLLSHFIDESKNQKKVENLQLAQSSSSSPISEYSDEKPSSDNEDSLTPELAKRIANIFSQKKPKAIKVSAHVYYPYQLMAFLDLLGKFSN